MARYLVTGSAGFIASRVSSMLLDSGHEVVGLDNLNDSYDVRMKYHRLDGLKKYESFEFHKIDISDRDGVSTFFDNYKKEDDPPFDAVINLAARAGVRASLENPWVYVDTNVTGSLNLLEKCREFEIPKFILASTSSVYGNDAPLPTPETARADKPLQSYSASKIGAEALAHAYHYLFGIDVSVVRYFTVYGPAGRPDMVMFRFVKWIREGVPLKVNGDGSQSRGFTYLDDIARGTIQALQPVGFDVFNLGGHEVITIQELIQLMERLMNQKASVEYYPFHKADMHTNQAEVTKAKDILGWKPQVSLEEGITKMIAWYDQNQTWASQISTD